MALTKPTLYNIPAFDTVDGAVFRFDAVGSDPSFNSINLEIYSINPSQLVYTQTYNQLDNMLEVPANILKNGKQYRARVRTQHIVGGEPTLTSPWSDYVNFYCYTTPELSIDMPTNGIVDSPSYEFQVQYSQSEREQLSTYMLNLYNSSKDLIASSGLITPTQSYPPVMGSYTFENLQNNSVYYVEYLVNTIAGTQVSTGLTMFTVNYIEPDEFSLLNLSNNCREGYVVIRSNIKVLQGVTTGSTSYADRGTSINLRNGAVDWNQNISFTGNVVAKLWFRYANATSLPPSDNKPLLSLSGDSGEGMIQVDWCEGYESGLSHYVGKAYCQLKVNPDNPSYVVYSNFISVPSSTQWCCLWVVKENNMYKLHLEIVS